MPKLPNAEFAHIPMEKLKGYVLNSEHPVGKNKANIFRAVFGLTAANANELRNAILQAVVKNEARPTRHDAFGQRYEVELEWERNNRKGLILTAWIIPKDESIPHLTTCYVK